MFITSQVKLGEMPQYLVAHEHADYAGGGGLGGKGVTDFFVCEQKFCTASKITH